MEKQNYYRTQQTLARPITLSGHGLHTGLHSSVTIFPAKPGHGIVFVHSSKRFGIPATRQYVDHNASTLSTVLSCRSGQFQTVEHVLSALAGMGITNAVIEVSSTEIPILDGSSKPYVAEILKAGILPQPGKVPVFEVSKQVQYRDGDRFFMASPYNGFHVDYSVHFGEPFRQRQSFLVTPHTYRTELASAKTFCLASDLEKIRNQGLAKGGTRENALILGESGTLNPEVQTFPDELVRHKILDFIGDMSLAGGLIAGAFVVERGGHRFHLECLEAMISENILKKVVPEKPPMKFGSQQDDPLNQWRPGYQIVEFGA